MQKVDITSSMNDMMDGIPMPPIPGEEDVIDVDSSELKTLEEVDPKSITIRTATPFIINTNESNGKRIATLTFLCVLDDDSIITISRNYILETDDDKDIIEAIDFHANSEFINNKICYNFIAKYLPAYFSTFKFTVNNLADNNEKQNLVTLQCINITNRSEIKNFQMNAEVYSAMNFIDDYVFKGEVENAHDLALATVVGSKVNNNVEFFVVDSIENIVTMVSTKKKPKGLEAIKEMFNKESDTNIGLVFRVSRTLPDKKETVSILTPFDTGVELDKSKFKGDTVEDLEKNYYGDSDQYVATLTVNDTHLEGIDKSYMTIRGKTKNGDTRIFLLDSAIQQDLIHKVKDY